MNLSGGDDRLAENVVSSLIKDGFIDDYRFATAYAGDKSALSGWGSIKISSMLRHLGISGEMITEALKVIDSEKSNAKLKKIIENKFKTLKSREDKRVKLIRFALGRGYSYEEASPIISEILKGE